MLNFLAVLIIRLAIYPLFAISILDILFDDDDDDDDDELENKKREMVGFALENINRSIMGFFEIIKMF